MGMIMLEMMKPMFPKLPLSMTVHTFLISQELLGSLAELKTSQFGMFNNF
uniref:Uncharacterized protein n=1 Tax=Anguilla anguilla TaxID=7936 RepID=A0A0E9UDU1_ANGAN